MRYLALTILVAACGEPVLERPSTRHLKDAVFDRVAMMVASGSVTVRTDPELEGALLTASTETDCTAEDGVLRVTADRADVELRVRPGLDLLLVTRDASVRVEGSWRGGKVTSAMGTLDVTIGAPPEDFTFTSSGDVAVAVSAKFKGTVQVAGASVEVTSHPLLFEKWGADRKTLTGYLPKRAGPLDPANLPRGIWVKSLKGKATFRLVD